MKKVILGLFVFSILMTSCGSSTTEHSVPVADSATVVVDSTAVVDSTVVDTVAH
jgi:uncharacterized protein YcfL